MEIYIESELFKEFIYGGELKFVYGLGILMIIDIITGISKSFKQGNLWSRKSTYGFGRKIMVFMIIIVCNILDTLFNLEGILVYASLVFYIVNESLSIVENYALMGGKIPKQVYEVLELLQEKNDTIDQLEQRVKVNENVTIEVKKESDD